MHLIHLENGFENCFSSAIPKLSESMEINFSLSSTIIRLAVFAPTPGIL